MDLRDTTPKTPELVGDRIRATLDVIPASRLVVAPDFGIKYLSRDVAFKKLVNMVRGRDIVLSKLE